MRIPLARVRIRSVRSPHVSKGSGSELFKRADEQPRCLLSWIDPKLEPLLTCGLRTRSSAFLSGLCGNLCDLGVKSVAVFFPRRARGGRRRVRREVERKVERFSKLLQLNVAIPRVIGIGAQFRIFDARNAPLFPLLPMEFS